MPLRPLGRTVRIPIENFAEFERELGRQVRQVVFDTAIHKAGKSARLLLERETMDKEIYFKGKFAKSWRIGTGSQPASVYVYNRQPYASVIEYGRRRGARMPPVKALIPWVVIKLGVPRSDARRVAFMVARKIHEYGIKPRPVIRDPEVRERLQQLIIDQVLRGLEAAAEKAADRYRGR